MGRVTPIGDPAALATALLEVLSSKQELHCDTDALRQLYDPETVAQEYESLFEEIKKSV